MVFNVMAANCDDHTKNFSFVMERDGRWRLSPAYDVTYAYNPKGMWTYQHLMSVNGKFKNIQWRDMEQAGERFGIPSKRDVYRQVSAAVARWPEFAAAAGLPPDEAKRLRQDFVIEK